MNTRKSINQLLVEIANKNNAPILQLNEQGVCAFRYNDIFDIVIEVNDPSSRVFFYTPLIHISHLKNKRLFEELLKANYLCLETQGATFSLNNKHDIVLCYWSSAQSLNATEFENTLKQFISVAQKWWNILKEHSLDNIYDQEENAQNEAGFKHYGLFV